MHGNISPGTPDAMARRLAGLPPECVARLRATVQAIDAGHLEAAATQLDALLAAAPGHPEILRLLGILRFRQKRFDAALDCFRRVLAAWPEDAATLGNVGTMLAGVGNDGQALETFRRAARADPESAGAWFNLGNQLEAMREPEDAAEAFARAVELEPRHVPARILHAEALNTLGRTGAAEQFRAAIRTDPHAAKAWLGLANLKVEPLTEVELESLHREFDRAPAGSAERTMFGFALGKALEDRGRYDRAFATFAEACAAKRATLEWDAAAFTAQMERWTGVLARGTTVADESDLGREAIFIVGLPRSGTTLVEQVLAAHPQVEGAGELPDLQLVLAAESTRRGQPFPDWVVAASPADWSRLGREYLARTARWRTRAPVFTDKRPENWELIGAAFAMLPGARIIDCRRDPVETCWSCLKQLFPESRMAASYDVREIAAYLRDHDAAIDALQARHADRIRIQSLEALAADVEGQARGLLAFCNLPYDDAVLRAHASARAIRTPSAAQVRQPIRPSPPLAGCYGGLLDPLRMALREHASGADVALAQRD
ncbi:MAG: sulfotransferase [Lysobacterales bacterium]